MYFVFIFNNTSKNNLHAIMKFTCTQLNINMYTYQPRKTFRYISRFKFFHMKE